MNHLQLPTAFLADLNGERPRPVLGSRTARDLFKAEPGRLPDRDVFRKEVREVETHLLGQTCSRRGQAAARRNAVEAVLLRYGLFKEMVAKHKTGLLTG